MSSQRMTEQESADARKWVQAGRASAIERFPYLDVALTSMVLVETQNLGTVATDARWRFYYDPARVLAIPRTQRLEVMVADWVHEVGHLLRDHPQRWEDVGDPDALHHFYNVAGDAVINLDLASLNLRLLPTDVTFDRLPSAAGAEPGMVTEEVYQRLKRIAVEVEAADCGSGSGGPQRPWEQPIDGAADDGSVDPARGDLVRHETASQVRSHIRTHGTESVPHRMRQWAEGILEPIVDWRRELRAAVSRGLSQAAGRTDYSFVRPPRRRVPGYRTPGMTSTAPPSVAVVVDTSGSMGADDLAQCIADIAALARSMAGASGAVPVSVIPCDMQPGPISRVRTKGDVPRIELTGGGGTNMGAGIELAAALHPTPDVVVTLTDGYTPWPDEPPPRAPRARYIAVVVTDDDTNAADRVPGWIHTIKRAA